MSLRLKVNIEMPINRTLCTMSTKEDCLICCQGRGSSKNERQEAMCVVNKRGRIGSKIGTSNALMIVKNKMIAIVATMGPIELSEKQDRQMDKELMVNKARNATQKAQIYLHIISPSCKITSPSEFKTIKSPGPKRYRPIPTAMNPSHKTIKKV